MFEESAEPAPPDATDLEAAPLSTAERAMCGGVGVGSFITGTIATFAAESEVGSGVLLAIGALFLLMATTGRPITSAKIGDNEIQLARRLIRKVEEKLDTASPDARAELAEAVIAAGPALWRPVAQKAAWVLFEEELAAELEKLAPDADIERSRRSGDWHVDLLLRQGDVVVGVESKLAGRRLNTDTVRQVVQGAHTAGIEKLIVVSSSGFTRGALAHQQERASPIQVELVQWWRGADDGQLAQALRRTGVRVRPDDRAPNGGSAR